MLVNMAVKSCLLVVLMLPRVHGLFLGKAHRPTMNDLVTVATTAESLGHRLNLRACAVDKLAAVKATSLRKLHASAQQRAM